MSTNVPVKSLSQLTTFAETSPEVKVDGPGAPAQVRPLINPYESQELTKVLSRKYEVAQFVWNHSDDPGYILTKVKFPASLFAIPNIQDKLNSFRWLRADVNVEIRLNATPFHIGAVQVSWLPRSSDGGPVTTAYAANIYQRSQNNGMVMSASAMNSLTFKIPRVSIDLMDPIAAANEDSIAILYIEILNKLMSASGVDPVSLTGSVFASFSEPEVVGYSYTPTPPLRMVKRLTSQKIKLQSARDPIAQESESKSRSGVISTVLDAVGNMAPMVAASPLAEFAPILEGAKAGAAFAKSLGFSKPTSLETTSPMVIDPLRDLNFGHGLTNANKLSFKPEAHLADTNLPGFKRHKISEIIGTPSLLLSGSMSGSTVNTVFRKWLVHPSVVPCITSTGGGTYIPTHLAFMSQAFRAWRGSLKYRIHFVGSAFVTTRVRIAHFPSGDIPSTLEDYAGDIVSQVVDVRGDTIVDFSVPYLGGRPYSPTFGYIGPDQDYSAFIPSTDNESVVTMSLVNPVVEPNPSGVALIYYNVYVAAGEDFVFTNYTRWNQLDSYGDVTAAAVLDHKPTKNVGTVKKQSLREAFSKPFNGLVPSKGSMEQGLVNVESYDTIEALLQRYNMAPPASIGLLESGFINNLFLIPEDDISAFGSLFRFYRGGMRFKLIPPRKSTTITTSEVYLPKLWAAYVRTFVQDNHMSKFGPARVGPSALCYDSVNPVVDFEIPWMSDTFARDPNYDTFPWDTTGEYERVILTDTDTIGTQWDPAAGYRAVADDFCFCHLLACLNRTYTTPTLRESTPSLEHGARVSDERSLVMKLLDHTVH